MIDILYTGSEKAWKHIQRALNSREDGGIAHAWLMARASYEFSRSHDLTVWESFSGAVWLFRYCLRSR